MIRLKLFIWRGFDPDYTNGLAFAIAQDEQEARRMVIEDRGYDPYEWGQLEVRRVDRRAVASVAGGG
jgi:hypothetical protein